MRTFEYRHIIAFEETNLVGNVYYVNHLRWQGRCRELFLARHAPGIIEQLRHELALVTLDCSCEYLTELLPFDEVSVRMSLVEQVQNRIVLAFEYWRVATDRADELVARGRQSVATMRREGQSLSATPIPAELAEALASYRADHRP